MTGVSPIPTMMRPLAAVAALAAALVLGAAVLWAWYGTTVFFEAIRAGWAACF